MCVFKGLTREHVRSRTGSCSIDDSLSKHTQVRCYPKCSHASYYTRLNVPSRSALKCECQLEIRGTGYYSIVLCSYRFTLRSKGLSNICLYWPNGLCISGFDPRTREYISNTQFVLQGTVFWRRSRALVLGFDPRSSAEVTRGKRACARFWGRLALKLARFYRPNGMRISGFDPRAREYIHKHTLLQYSDD